MPHLTKPAIWVALLLFLLIGLAGCGGEDTGNTYAVTKTGVGAISQTAADPIIFSFGTTRNDYIMAPYTIEHVNIDGDTLRMDVSYTGGCEEHLFELVALNDFLVSQPVQADVLLTHDANRDDCGSVIKETLLFNLLSIKEEYKIVFKTENGTVTLRIEDPAQPEGYLSATYSF